MRPLILEQPPFRPPSESHSLLIRATRNCPWNRCTFCSMYKTERFELRPVEEIKEEVLNFRSLADELWTFASQVGAGDQVGEVARYNGILWLENEGVRSAFLGDSNSLIMPTDDLVEVVGFLYQTFPTLERVTSYARAHTIRRKSLEDLRRLREAGLNRLHVGLETGDDELLQEAQKGATAQEMIEAGQKALEAGFELSEYVMPGLGGVERWEQHVAGTARVLNAINPHLIRLRTLGVAPGTPLWERSQRGEFHTQSIEGLLIEVRRLVESLEVTSEVVSSDFSANYYLGGMDGRLPQDRAEMLKAVDRALAHFRARAR